MDTMTMIEFLYARHDEEELAARAARAVSTQSVDITCEYPELRHLWLRFGPARVLRELEPTALGRDARRLRLSTRRRRL
jgi:hypothetical protein